MQRWERWSPFSGVVFVALFVLGAVPIGETGETPSALIVVGSALVATPAEQGGELDAGAADIADTAS
ncbi:MAG: hypothetical protein H0T39_02890 [Actinobacteria bacterium]|nr:hypothetical protein [Actinomycetota bacterium]